MINFELSNEEIVLYSLYLLGGWHKRIHTEDVALKCFELAPSKFSWTKYPKYPDLAPARFALESAKNNQYGSLVEGESERKKNLNNIGGWRLTEKGVKWVKEKINKIETILGKHKQIGDRLFSNRRLKSLINSIAFQKYLKYGDESDITYSQFTESLICTVNTSKQIIIERLKQFTALSEKFGKDEIINYLNYCHKKFNNILN